MNEGCERYDESILSKHFSKRNSVWPESTTVILIHAPEDLQLTRRKDSGKVAQEQEAWDTHRETRLEQIAFPGTEGDSVGDSIEHIGTRGVDVGGDVDVMVINDARIDL